MQTIEKVTLELPPIRVFGRYAHGGTMTYPLNNATHRANVESWVRQGATVVRRWCVYTTDSGYPLGVSSIDLDRG